MMGYFRGIFVQCCFSFLAQSRTYFRDQLKVSLVISLLMWGCPELGFPAGKAQESGPSGLGGIPWRILHYV